MQSFAGWLCLVLGVALVVVHIVLALRKPATAGSSPTEAMPAVVEKLADKAPSLAGGIVFVVLGLIVLGVLDIQLVAGASDTQAPK